LAAATGAKEAARRRRLAGADGKGGRSVREVVAIATDSMEGGSEQIFFFLTEREIVWEGRKREIRNAFCKMRVRIMCTPVPPPT
jgi:hypothetical protein